MMLVIDVFAGALAQVLVQGGGAPMLEEALKAPLPTLVYCAVGASYSGPILLNFSPIFLIWDFQPHVPNLATVS